MSNLALEYQGFLRFINRAKNDLIKWYGAWSKNDPIKIANMAAKEWDVMDSSERKFFIRSYKLDAKRSSGKKITDSNNYISFMLQKRYSHDENLLDTNSDPRLQYNDAQSWKSLSEEERQKFSDFKLTELGMDHVIDKRDRLHQMYQPNELNFLELILKTKPAKPINSRTWFLRMETRSINSDESTQKWRSMSKDDRNFYEGFSKLDRKRYNFEKKAWITKLLQSDLESGEFDLEGLMSLRTKTNVDTIISLVEPNKNYAPVSFDAKRPLSPFSLFIRAYRYQIRDEKPEFQFGRHLRESSSAWHKLSEEEKQKYKDESKKLWDDYRRMKEDKIKIECGSCGLPVELFTHSKTNHGPSKPSHLVDRLPSVENFFAQRRNIPRNERDDAWLALTQDEREEFIKEHQKLKDSINSDKAKLESKLKKIKDLIEKAEKLEKFKRDLRLLTTRNKTVKLYA